MIKYMPKPLLLIFALTMVLPFSGQSHTPSNISFLIKEEAGSTELSIHLTSQTIFDLLYHLKPELRDQAAINLGAYGKLYEQYFNENLDIRQDQRAIALDLIASDVRSHDSYLTFTMRTSSIDADGFAFGVDAFSFYRKPSFVVYINTAGLTGKWRLNKTNNSLGTDIQQPGAVAEFPFALVMLYLGSVLMVSAVVLFVFFRQKQSASQPAAPDLSVSHINSNYHK